MQNVKSKKSLGQHFLTDKNIAGKIVRALPASKEDRIFEIGPGEGILTDFLLEQYANLELIELDGEAADFLKKKYKNLDLIIHREDILKWAVTKTDSWWIGNLPYNISSQIFFKLLDNMERIKGGVFMIQKEVAERIAAPHGSKTYGILSVLLQSFYHIQLEFTVPPQVFRPPPKVQSAVILLERKSDPPQVDFKALRIIVKTAFNHRRKTLRNCLKAFSFDEITELKDWKSKRAEALSPEDFWLLTKALGTDEK